MPPLGMCTITDIQPTRKGRYSIFLDGEFYCALHVDIFATAHLRIQQVIALADIEEIRRRSERKEAKDRALRLLSQREYASGHLRRKLLEYADQEAADAAIARMQELGLVDDYDYALRYTRDCYNLKGYSYIRAKQALLERGVPREIAQQALEEVEYDAAALILQLLHGRYASRMQTPENDNKVAAALVRRGFSPGDVYRAMREFKEKRGLAAVD